MVPNIIAYHTNSVSKAKKFVEKKEMIFFSDKQYLGYGMYFWDNQGNAKYWAGKKLRENKGFLKQVQICKANILLDEPVLDLTDITLINLVRELWLGYCKKQGETKTKQFLGTILDVLRDFFPEIQEMKVSTFHGDYSHYTKTQFLQTLGSGAHIDNRPRTIYAVTCESKVNNPEYFELVSI